MNIGFGNQQVQNQHLALTPKMLEELKVLQMSNFDLIQYIEEAAAENPMLEVDEPDALWDMINRFEIDKKGDTVIDTGNEDTQADFLNYSSISESLREHLVLQLREVNINETYRRTALYIIDNIDTDGYLRTGIREIAYELNISKDKVIKALKLIQNMDPEGVGARNLKECLTIQLRRKRKDDKDTITVIKNYLELLGEHKYDLISKKSGIPKSKVSEIHDIIRALNPKPGYKFSNRLPAEYINPELIIKEIDANYMVMFIDERVPSLKINEHYRKLLLNGEATSDESNYIKHKLSKAVEIINAIEMRKRTILGVADYIVKYQEGFLRKGYSYLKPLTMRAVADGVGLSESTISRTVNKKYIQTNRGIFELKYFFSAEIITGNDNNFSANSVKDAIRKIIMKEDKSKPLSDEQIRRALEEKGMKVARRTVAKYREGLSILPANMRKQ